MFSVVGNSPIIIKFDCSGWKPLSLDFSVVVVLISFLREVYYCLFHEAYHLNRLVKQVRLHFLGHPSVNCWSSSVFHFLYGLPFQYFLIIRNGHSQPDISGQTIINSIWTKSFWRKWTWFCRFSQILSCIEKSYVTFQFKVSTIIRWRTFMKRNRYSLIQYRTINFVKPRKPIKFWERD